jgi:hypothetical protein
MLKVACGLYYCFGYRVDGGGKQRVLKKLTLQLAAVDRLAEGWTYKIIQSDCIGLYFRKNMQIFKE